MNFRSILAMDKSLAFDPPVSEKQRRAMWAAANGHSTLGIPKKVGEEFVGDAAPATAAGVMLIAPDGKALFLKRGTGSDHAGTWAWPGGGIEENETSEEAARRETSEEIGHTVEDTLEPIDHQAHEQGAFTTFYSGVSGHFLPELNGEHSAYAWAPLNDPPQPLHPGVEATLKKLQTIAQDCFAFDKATVRRIDEHNGHMHVGITNISKANVCPYLGKEIPDWQSLGLDPEKVYMLYRDPEELAKAAPTFNNLPLLSKHIETTADDHKKDFTVGSTGTDAAFNAPYLQNSLVIWDGPYIDAVEDESQKELSSAYRYRADMTSGEVTLDGQPVKYDGVMRDIIGNHVALVKEGRAGSDVVVGDSKEELQMKNALSLKAVMARGAIAAFLAPKLAQDAKIPLSALLAGVTAKNFAAKKPLLLKGLNDAIKGKLAKDESAEGLKTLLDALETAPVVDDMDPMEDATFDKDDLNKGVNPLEDNKDDPSKGEDDPMQAIMEFLKGKLSPEDMAQIEAMCNAEAGQATDDPPPFPGMPKTGAGKKDDPTAKDKDMVSKEDAEKMVKGASDAVRAEVLKTQREIRDAERLVKPYVGEMAMACDSASHVLKTALGALNVEGIESVNDVVALTAILKAQPLPGSKKETVVREHAFDSAGAKSFAERNPGVARIKSI